MSNDNSGWWRRNVNRVARPEEQSDAQAKRAPWVLIAFLALVVIVAVVVWALRVFWFEPSQTAEPEPQPAATTTATASPVESEPPAKDSTCKLDATPRDISSIPPTATRWVVERWAALPEVEGAGPCVEQDKFRAGFAQTQTGAVLAAYHYVVHGIPASPDDGTRGLLEHALLDGPLKNAILKQVDDVENGVEARIPESRYNGVQIGGYRISSFEKNSAVVELLIRTNESAGSITTKLLWEDNDWRIDPASETGWGATRSNVRASDFVAWSAQAGG